MTIKNYIEDLDAISKFGIITRVYERPEVSIKEHLLTKTSDMLQYILNNSYVSVEVTALDLSYIGLTTEEFNISTKYLVQNGVQNYSELLTVVQIDLDLLAPWNSKLTFSSTTVTATSASNNIQSAVETNKKESVVSANKISKKITIADDNLKQYEESNDLALITIRSDVAEKSRQSNR